MKGRIALVLALGAVVASTACSSNKAATTPTPTPSTSGTVVQVVLEDFKITPSSGSFTGLPAGSVTFEAHNEGTQNHEFVLVKTDLAADKLPVDKAKATVDEAKLNSLGEIEEFAKGTVQSKAFTLAAGKYVAFCNISGHYQLGMHAAITAV